jgi:hypothetical protein
MEAKNEIQNFKESDQTQKTDHNLVTLSLVETASFLESQVQSNEQIGKTVHLIVISKSSDSFLNLVDNQNNKNKSKLSYIANESELAGTVSTVQSLILFNNAKTNTDLTIVTFDLGSDIWNDKNFSAFEDLVGLVKIAKKFGVVFNFINLPQTAQRMALELEIE